MYALLFSSAYLLFSRFQRAKAAALLLELEELLLLELLELEELLELLELEELLLLELLEELLLELELLELLLDLEPLELEDLEPLELEDLEAPELDDLLFELLDDLFFNLLLLLLVFLSLLDAELTEFAIKASCIILEALLFDVTGNPVSSIKALLELLECTVGAFRRTRALLLELLGAASIPKLLIPSFALDTDPPLPEPDINDPDTLKGLFTISISCCNSGNF